MEHLVVEAAVHAGLGGRPHKPTLRTFKLLVLAHFQMTTELFLRKTLITSVIGTQPSVQELLLVQDISLLIHDFSTVVAFKAEFLHLVLGFAMDGAEVGDLLTRRTLLLNLACIIQAKKFVAIEAFLTSKLDIAQAH